MLLTRVVANKGFSFEIKRTNNPYAVMAENEIYGKLDRARAYENEGR